MNALDETYAAIDALIGYAVRRLDLDPRNEDWTRNRILELYGLDSYDVSDGPTGDGATSGETDDINVLLDRFRTAAATAGLFGAEDGAVQADIVRGLLSRCPADLQDRFAAIERERGGKEAMRWFYDYCVANTYVKRAQLDAKRVEADKAAREGDLEKASRILYGEIPAIQKELAAAERAVDDKAEQKHRHTDAERTDDVRQPVGRGEQHAHRAADRQRQIQPVRDDLRLGINE